MDFSVEPYFDDFEGDSGAKSKNFMRILFRPGYAVQARELTQLQSILQNQIGNLGDFIFKDGSPVEGGHITFDNTVKSIKLQANDNVTLADFDNQLIINSVGSATKRAVVIATDDTTQSDSVAGSLIIKYLTGSEFADSETIEIATGTQREATLVSSNSSTKGSIVSINEGVFYVDGYFIYVPPQTIVLDPESTKPTYRIGLEIDDSIVDESEDSTLLDPAQGAFNYQAPGATRYQYNLVLSKRLLSSTDDSRFFELLRIENGVVTKQVEYPMLGNIEKTLARRTYDESGDYTVRPFKVTVSDDPANTSTFLVNIEPGKAYVKGFEFETISTVRMVADKARSTNTSTDYNMSLEFGNYVTATNVYSGNLEGFSTENFGKLDLHIVPSGQVNTANQQAYTNTKIGTARVRDIEYAGTGTHYAYLLDVNIPPIVVNAASVGANTLALPLPATFTSTAGAIANVPISILAGNSSGDSRSIVSYNASTKIAVVDRAFTQLIDTSSLVSLNFGVKDINSLVRDPGTYTAGTANVYATKNSASGLFPCMDISVSGKDTLGNTILYRSEFNRLDYRLPESFIAQNSFSNVYFTNRKTLTNVSFTAGNTTIATGSGLDSNELYPFGVTSGYLSDQVARLNFFVIVRDKQTSNLSNGQVVIWDRGSVGTGNGVFQTSTTSVTLDTITTGNFIGDVLLNVRDNNASVNFRRTKTLTGNTSNTTLKASDAPTNGTNIVGTANVASVKFDAANGYLWFTNANDIVKTPGVRQSLYVPDVVKVIAIYESGNNSHAPNTTNARDITDHFLFDSGQRDNYYDHASIILRDGVRHPSGQTVVMFQYYAHDSTSGFFSADSYSASEYQNGTIPYYASEKFGYVALRDAIDFRPTRTIGTSSNVQVFAINGLRLPQPDSVINLSYSFYLPRIDKLVLTRDKQFKLLSGTPAVYPQIPADTDDSMSLYTITVPAYTAHPSDVQLAYIENKRYTMRDIGALDKRIEQLEYYTSLNTLENNTTKKSILYTDGATAKEHYGIITDSFIDFSVADTQNPDLLCYMHGGNLLPFQQHTPFEFMFQNATGPYKVNDRTYSLNYTETPAVVQNTATKAISVQPFAFAQFRGEIDLRPQTDFYFASEIVPQIIAPPAKPVEPPPPPPPLPAPPVVVPLPPPPPAQNPAQLVPQIITNNPPPEPPSLTGTAYMLRNRGRVTYCIPIVYLKGSFVVSRTRASNDNGKLTATNYYINGEAFTGKQCQEIAKYSAGFGAISHDSHWFPVHLDPPNQTASSQTQAAPPPVSIGSTIRIGGGISGSGGRTFQK